MRRIPRIARLEFVLDFLEGVRQNLDLPELERKLGNRKLFFESEKYKALGRGSPFGEKRKIRLMKARSTLDDCIRMCRMLRLLEPHEKLALTADGVKLATLTVSEQIHPLGQLMLDNYPSFKTFLMRLRDLPRGEVSLPDIRHSKRPGLYTELAKNSRIELDGLDFLRVRDILSQLGLTNWYREKREGETWSTVFLTSAISSKTGVGNSVFRLANDGAPILAEINTPSKESFFQAFWDEYMKKTNYVQWRPIFYSDLRTCTCTRLRLCDAVFDKFVSRMMEGNDTIQVIWSSGTFPRINDTSSLLKNLPPMEENGNYMVYLKLGRK